MERTNGFQFTLRYRINLLLRYDLPRAGSPTWKWYIGFLDYKAQELSKDDLSTIARMILASE